jgi:predicted urease superfamily metal-dependent hydrolase
MTIDEEIRDVLEDLVGEIGATSARIVIEDDQRTGVPARTLALGGGEYLRVELPTHVERTTGREHDIEAAFERVIRQLRVIRRKYEIAHLPEITIAPGASRRATRSRSASRGT